MSEPLVDPEAVNAAVRSIALALSGLDDRMRPASEAINRMGQVPRPMLRQVSS